jgi:hypothetical protein
VLFSTYGLMLRELLASRLLPQLTKELAPLTQGALTPDAALMVCCLDQELFLLFLV